MKTKRLASHVAVAALLAASMVACNPFAAQHTATPKPTDTAQPTHTAQATSTSIPPTKVPPTPTFPAALSVNGLDPVKVLISNGFAYAGGQQVGSCAASCAVYDNANVGLRVIVYADGALSSTGALGPNASAQVDVMYEVVEQIYGASMTAWMVNHAVGLLQGQAQDGKVGSFAIHMESPGPSLIAVTITPAK